MKKNARRKTTGIQRVVLSIIIVLLVGGSLYYYFSTRHYRIRSVTNTFLSYEQTGDYGASWNLLHSYMKDHFPQSDYEKLRSQLFLEDFAVKSPHFQIESIKHLDNWKPTNSGPNFKDAYQVSVEETFNSQFGNELLVSNYILTRDPKDHNHWRILWDMGS